MSGSALLPLVALIVALGIASQVLADRFQVPSVLFLLVVGLVLGPGTAALAAVAPGLSGPLIGPDSFGNALSAIVGLAVAIIVFEGAFHLHIDRLRQAPSETLRLVTVGAVIGFVGTTATVRYALGADWTISALIGALLVATGPTVITPIMKAVPVRDRVSTALETEGIVNDVTAAILAVVVFEALQNDVSAPGQLAQLFATRVGTGIVVGLAVAAVVYYVLRHVDLSPANAPQNARLLVLAGALVAFAAANTIASEAGIAAVATAGVVLGNADLPYEDTITKFKGDITLIVLSFVFIALAALLDVNALLALGWGGVALVLILMFVIRPLAVWVSTTGGRLTRNERVFISLLGPRGIIPASVATLFAVEIAASGGSTAEGQAGTLVGAVFVVIFTTVALEGGLARQVAQRLDIIPMRTIIVGAGRVGRALADRLEERGENVVLVDNDQTAVEQARADGHRVHHGDGTSTDVLRSAGIENARIAVAATGDDDVNLLVAQHADSTFDVENVVVRVNQPDNVSAVEELGVNVISAAFATAQAIDNVIERPALNQWMSELGRSGDVQEISVTSGRLVGRTIEELGPKLPDGCLIALIYRDGENLVPQADLQLQEGDRITIIGERGAVREAMEWCHPE
jgi:NhaP-type Na+/H+ or K+/H+ antiporter/K+/H+ antiporter YhaU regulatory subunit KhtT